ncbi:ataxin-10-like [Gigantopelta aegis]|uniref:ataxin-10-like n=1 Tax=Gigantopelta aegis TaxID=1735272 RepID=UPI001B88BEED|nr:ataxin-10-like [Gigantopelta aegis]
MNFEEFADAMVVEARNQSWKEVKDSLSHFTNEFKSDDFRNNAGPRLFGHLANTLSSLKNKLMSEEDIPIEVEFTDCLAEYYRCLRNACASCHDNQELARSTLILMNTRDIVQKLNTENRDETIVCVLQCAVQFLGNTCVRNSFNQSTVWDMFLSDDYRNLLMSGDVPLADYTCMLLHTCIRGLLVQGSAHPTYQQKQQHLSQRDTEDYPHDILQDPGVQEYLTEAIRQSAANEFEWGVYLIEDLCQFETFLSVLYDKLTDKERIFVVEVLINLLKQMSDCLTHDRKIGAGVTNSDNCAAVAESKMTVDDTPEEIASSMPNRYVGIDNLRFLSEEIQSKCLQVIRVVVMNCEYSLTPWLIVKNIEALGIATSLHTIYGALQEDTDLLMTSLDLLNGIHDINKGGENHFVGAEKPKEIDPSHPSFCLKRDLVRLIANMVYHHPVNQDRVREMDGIPLLLDLSGVDDRNPFITQWVVLAIRNLLEGNDENKAIVNEMQMEGMANNVSLLKEYGISAELQGNKIIVKPPKPGHGT